MAEGGVGRASLLLASGTVVSRILGFVKTIVLANAVGVTSVSGNAIATATMLPNSIYVIVAGGVLNAVLVPQIVRAGLHLDGGRAYINKLVTIALVVLAGTAIVATLLAPLIVFLYASSYSSAQLALATAFAYWSIPQIFFYGMYTVLGEVLNARKSFGPYTWAPVLNNVVGIAGIVLFIVLFGADDGTRGTSFWTPAMIAIIGGSATLGIASQAIVLFYFWRRIGLRYRPDFRWRGVGLGEAGRIASWTFAMLIVTQIAALIETNIANTAGDSGAPSTFALSTSWLVFMLPHSIITLSIATVYFTRMSEHGRPRSPGEGGGPDYGALRSDFSSAIRSIGLLIVLAAAVLIVVAYPFAAIYTDEFGEIQAVGNLIIAFVFGLVGFSVLFVVQRTFYALGDTRTPFFFTLFQAILLSAGVVACLLLPVEVRALGIAVVTTVAGTAQLILAAVLLRRRIGGLGGRSFAPSMAKYIIAAFPALLVGLLVLWALGGTSDGGFGVSSKFGAILCMIVVGIAMALVYFVGLVMLRSPDLADAVAPVVRRLRRGRP
ncbi:murein biosynthesis integral membrane protein MurJ [Compostimonas suwonensis]|uniref:Putative peptidoglycan lipid II flippase n=1 Tax=Compostimonas suwonensis TaxID=1048394 RepID=A0A2M9C492_9MICO|nr:lipid II flippase MurJ [Compostimonas suwonensis]PJJ65309.1 putative peptidoglycan lipid II flippase [Compostimonas suwonensis]